MTKSECREFIKSQVQENKPAFPELSKGLCNQILKCDSYKNSAKVFAYMPLPDEPDLRPVIIDALERGKEVYLPKVISSNSIDFYRVENLQQLNSLKKGSFNILEPDSSLRIYNIDNLQKSDGISFSDILILVPGRAFSKNGERLGRGKGYYDFFLSKFAEISKPVFMGTAFSFQILTQIPSDKNDVMMDLIITERGLV